MRVTRLRHDLAKAKFRLVRQLRFDLMDPAPKGVAAVAILLFAADWGSQVAGDSLFPGGFVDESAHLLITLLALWALGLGARRRFLVPAMVASVAIDLDHVPARLGSHWLTVGTPRPYTHSLLTIVVLLAFGLLVRRHRDLASGVAIGLAIHFFRDLSEPNTGVALLWPWSRQSFSLPGRGFLAAAAALVLVDAARLRGYRRDRSLSVSHDGESVLGSRGTRVQNGDSQSTGVREATSAPP